MVVCLLTIIGINLCRLYRMVLTNLSQNINILSVLLLQSFSHVMCASCFHRKLPAGDFINTTKQNHCLPNTNVFQTNAQKSSMNILPVLRIDLLTMVELATSISTPT